MAINHDFVVPKNVSNVEHGPLDRPSISMIVGAPGSGKTTVLANLLDALQKKHEFDSGLYVTGNNRDPIIKSIQMPIATTPSQLQDYITGLKQAKEGTNHVIVLDDIQGSPDFNVMTAKSDFNQTVLSHRHYGEDPKKPDKFGTHVIMTAQRYKNSFAPTIKSAIKNMFLFYPNRYPRDVKDYEEFASDPVAMKRAMSLLKTKDRHSFIYLNRHDPKQDRYFLGFNDELKDLH